MGKQLSYPLYGWYNTALHPIINTIEILDTDVVIPLGFNGAISDTVGPKSLHRISDSTNYSVTAGKSAKLIVVFIPTTSTPVIEIIEDTAADAGTGAIKHTTPALTLNVPVTVVIENFAASRFVTFKVTTSGDIMRVVSAVVIES